MLGFSSLFAQLEKNHPMPKWGYTITGLDPDTTVKSSGRELSISHKAAREICQTIKNMTLDQAKTHLNNIIVKKQPVPFKRYKKKAGHRHGLQKAYAGRYPIKAAQKILKVLEGAEANAESKGLDPEKLKIIHAVAYPGMKIKRYTMRAFGSSSPKFQTLTHVELVLQQTEEKTT
jgi:large subunit ribosomal protein L22